MVFHSAAGKVALCLLLKRNHIGYTSLQQQPQWNHIMSDGQVRQKIIDKLTQAFAPQDLEVIDESHLHAGHSGARPEGETHFRVKVRSETFEGTTLLARHRLINDTLADELAGPVHALAIEAKV